MFDKVSDLSSLLGFLINIVVGLSLVIGLITVLLIMIKLVSKRGTFIKPLIIVGVISVIIFILSFSARLLLINVLEEPRSNGLPICAQEPKVFEYEGCVVKYSQTIDNGKCNVCEPWVHPCTPGMGGFTENERIDILTCLCNADKVSAAINFTKSYIPSIKDPEKLNDVCNNVPDKWYAI